MTPMGALVQLGWDEAVADTLGLDSMGAGEAAEPARVLRVDRGEVDLATASGDIRATMTKAAKDCVAGDWVLVDAAKERVVFVAPRSTAFVRRSARGGRAPQTLAANMEWVLICQAFSPGVNLRRLERELVLAYDSGARPLVVIAKLDTVSPDEASRMVMSVEGVTHADVLSVSNVTGEGIEELRRVIAPGETFALVGSSGVGKSSIVNTLTGSQRQSVGEVRSGDEKGRHTTTAAELVRLPDGRLLLDTPGVRALALWQPRDGLAMAFHEITDLAGSCRFADCRHEHEPGCAVGAALQNGALDSDRYESWSKMRDEIDEFAETLEEQRQTTSDRRH